MQQYTLTIPVTVKQEDELSEQEKQLVEAAKQATYRSYAPYSRFCVGAAALLGDGTLITGSNQENAASPSGICAERTTIFHANSEHPDQPVLALAIAARDTSGQFTERPISPCGACRQVLVETESRYRQPIAILLYGTLGTHIISSAKELLPVSFDASYL